MEYIMAKDIKEDKDLLAEHAKMQEDAKADNEKAQAQFIIDNDLILPEDMPAAKEKLLTEFASKFDNDTANLFAKIMGWTERV